VGIAETELGDLAAAVCVGEDGIEIRSGGATASIPSFSPPVPGPRLPDFLAESSWPTSPVGPDPAVEVYWCGSDLVVLGRARGNPAQRHDLAEEPGADPDALAAKARALAARRLEELLEEIAAGRLMPPAPAANLRVLGRLSASDRARLAEALARDFDRGAQEMIGGAAWEPRHDSAARETRAEIRVPIAELASRLRLLEEERRVLGRLETVRDGAARTRAVIIGLVVVPLAVVVLKAMARRTAGAAVHR